MPRHWPRGAPVTVPAARRPAPAPRGPKQPGMLGRDIRAGTATGLEDSEGPPTVPARPPWGVEQGGRRWQPRVSVWPPRLPESSLRDTLSRPGIASPRTSSARPLPPPRQHWSLSASASGAQAAPDLVAALLSDGSEDRSHPHAAQERFVSLSPTLCRWSLLTSAGKSHAFQVLCVGAYTCVCVSLPSTNLAVIPRPFKAQRAASACPRPAGPRAAWRPSPPGVERVVGGRALPLCQGISVGLQEAVPNSGTVVIGGGR